MKRKITLTSNNVSNAIKVYSDGELMTSSDIVFNGDLTLGLSYLSGYCSADISPVVEDTLTPLTSPIGYSSAYHMFEVVANLSSVIWKGTVPASSLMFS